ncbi:hypothetical protein Acr_11g0015640 [Actinidia rufa]|uniref:Uncharacterized protein n=1 Tax=Actinidia rufa TaxID=165716 RepID=A0A7J0FF03_9ERIC|nr:hypothetical protein Acr_11g0015640 [Actinidia rufa]
MPWRRESRDGRKDRILKDSGGDQSSQVFYLAQGRGGDSTLALGDLTSTLKVAMSSMEMTWRGPMDSFYLSQEGSEINFRRDHGRAVPRWGSHDATTMEQARRTPASEFSAELPNTGTVRAKAIVTTGLSLLGTPGMNKCSKSSGERQRPAMIPRDVKGQNVTCTMNVLLTVLISRQRRRRHDDGLLTTPQRHGRVMSAIYLLTLQLTRRASPCYQLSANTLRHLKTTVANPLQGTPVTYHVRKVEEKAI